MHLWMDTAPPVVEVRCIRAETGAELRVSNRWRLDHRREDEWLNDFGMLIEKDAMGRTALRCSDGYGVDVPSFDDLVVRIEQVA